MLVGMSLELVNQTPAALDAYNAGFRLIDDLAATKPRKGPKDEKVIVQAFKDHRELWRWIERLLRRRCIVAARQL
jgi:hypothetical protein